MKTRKHVFQRLDMNFMSPHEPLRPMAQPFGDGASKRPTCAPIVLCNANYYGTLAAVRSLGRAGVPVVTVDPSMLAPARYSRYSGSHLNSPPFELTADWAEWLLRYGRTGPRKAIYATSDAVSFALAR